MNARRAANRGASHRSATRGSMSTREEGQVEKGFSRKMSDYDSHDSPRSYASMGSGPNPGAGEMPPIGPGKAAQDYATLDTSGAGEMSVGSKATPRGMKVYREE
jgi:hypothetical protein